MKKYIGDKAFYLMVFSIAVPIMIQNGITNFVAMLDNIMIGQIGTEQMSGVAVANQLYFVFNLTVFGMVSGAGIFGAQYYGSNNIKGMRDTFRFKLISLLILTVAGAAVLYLYGKDLIMLFLHGEEKDSIQKTLVYGYQYLKIMMIGLLPFSISQAYASSLREMGETELPMKAGMIAVVTNMVLNYILIFGKCGAPKLGVAGAAIATVISRFAECTAIMIWTHYKAEQYRFVIGAWRSMRIPGHLVRQILTKGTPLMLNELLWSMGMAILNQCYSTYGLDVVAGLNISTTISNVLNGVWIAMGGAISIIIGQLLGANKMDEAVDTDNKLLFFSVVFSAGIGVILIILSVFFPRLYNTTAEVRKLASSFMTVSAFLMPVHSFLNAAYFTIRSGGKTIITFLFDSGFVWICSIPLAFVLSRFSGLSILPTYVICQSAEMIKCVIGAVLLKKGIWLQNIVAE